MCINMEVVIDNGSMGLCWPVCAKLGAVLAGMGQNGSCRVGSCINMS